MVFDKSPGWEDEKKDKRLKLCMILMIFINVQNFDCFCIKRIRKQLFLLLLVFIYSMMDRLICKYERFNPSDKKSASLIHVLRRRLRPIYRPFVYLSS